MFLENLEIPDVIFRSKGLVKKKEDHLSISASTFSLFDELDAGATNEVTEIEQLLQEHDDATEVKNGATNTGAIIHEEKSEIGTVRMFVDFKFVYNNNDII